MDRPDLRKIAGNIRESLADFDREALVEILTYVFKEYVVEGPPPALVNQVETIDDLKELSFAELIQTLQTRLDLAELGSLQVQGDQVLVRAAGTMTPITAADASAPAAPAPTPQRSQPEESVAAPPPEPGVSFIETRSGASGMSRASVDEAVARGRGDLAGGQRGAVTPPPPRPRGVSISGRSAATPSPTSGPAAPAPAAASPPADKKDDKPADAPDKPSTEPSDDDASIRFSLLELD